MTKFDDTSTKDA